MSTDDGGDDGATARRVGPEALLLPLLGLAWWLLEGGLAVREDAVGRPSRVVDDPPTVRAWVGEWADAAGGTLRARLTPLHADPTTQSFDARVLRVRLGLPEGEPWRLELAAEGEDGLRFRLVEPRLTAEDERALGPVDGLAAGAEQGPLATLFAVPDPDRRMARVQLGLWGPPPAAETLDLVGLVLDDGTRPALTLTVASRAGEGLPRSLGTLAVASIGAPPAAGVAAAVAAPSADGAREDTTQDETAPFDASQLDAARSGTAPSDAAPSDAAPSDAAPSDAMPSDAARLTSEGPPSSDADELARARTRIEALEAELAELDAELTRAVDARIERERAYVAFQRSLAGVDDPTSLEEQVRMMLGLPLRASAPDGSGRAPGDADGTSIDAGAEAAADEAAREAREASAARARTLNVLLRSEGVWTLELLEAGELHYHSPAPEDDPPTAETAAADAPGAHGRAPGAHGPETAGPETPGPETAGPEAAGPETAGPEAAGPEGREPVARASGTQQPATGAADPDVGDGDAPVSEATRALLESPRAAGTGPVVFRQLDDRGRLAGGIRAARLRLEGSRAGRSLTLVLADGAFLEGGRERPFEDPEHRIELRHVDPEPFMAALPELFAPGDLVRRVDDGRWSVPLVRTELNALLAREPGGARYRLVWLGGVVDDELREVELELRDDRGVVERRVVADALRIDLDPERRTVVLRLRDGATLRGEEKAPFLEGRMPIVVPRVDVDAWAAAPLPGIAAAARDGGG